MTTNSSLRMLDIIIGVGVGICIAGVVLAVIMAKGSPLPELPAIPKPPAVEEPQSEPEGPPRFVWDDEVKFTPEPSVMVSRAGNKAIDITIFGEGGKVLAVIDPSGRVTVSGDVDEAARRFWQALGDYRVKCDEEH